MADRARILLTGSTGQVGGALLLSLAGLGEVIAPARQEMDMADPCSVRDFIAQTQPRWIVNCAAYTAVDKAESEPEAADAVNHRSVAAIGEAAARSGAAVIHFSTDYVFAGEGEAPYREHDATGPRNVYGASKLAGEQALAASKAAHLILRTSWVFGATGRNFLTTILRLAGERDRLPVVDDQFGAPTWSRDLARLTAHLIVQCECTAGGGELIPAMARRVGVYHACGGGETTWFGFAAEALRLYREMHPEVKLAALAPVASSEFPVAACRPRNSRLACKKLQAAFGWKMMDWQDALRATLGEL